MQGDFSLIQSIQLFLHLGQYYRCTNKQTHTDVVVAVEQGQVSVESQAREPRSCKWQLSLL